MTSIGFGREKGIQDSLKPKGFKASVYSLLLSTLAINILSLALPVMTLQIYDRILPNPGTGTLSVLVVGVCLAVFLEAVLRLCRAYIIGRAGASYEHLVACQSMRHILNADLARMRHYGIGEHLHRMGAVSKMKDFYNGYSLVTMAELVFVPMFLALMYYIAGLLVLVPIAILGLFIIISHWRGVRLCRALKKREDADDNRFNFLIESLEGIHTIKSFALEKYFERRYEALETESCRENYEVTHETSSTFNMSAIFSHLMVVSIISVGAILVLKGQLTTGGLIAMVLLSGRMMQPIQKSLGIWARYQDFILARKKMEDLYATPQNIVMMREGDRDCVPDGMLEMKNVSFRYNQNDPLVLKNVNFSLKRGDVMLLTGGHGVGKTTLFNLIVGIYRATSGNVLVDGEDIKSFETDNIPHHVGYIRTRDLIFRGTIRENITSFGQIDENQAKEIATLLHVDKEVAKLPGGFDTFLSGNNTDNISPGLKQRISMVRVLATKPKIILFDDADRSLDREGYAMIYSLLARLKGKATMILISDDHNIRSLATQFYYIEGGEIHETRQTIYHNNIRPYKELRL